MTKYKKIALGFEMKMGYAKSRCSAKLLSEVSTQVDKKHSEVNFYLIQFLTGHGHFSPYFP